MIQKALILFCSILTLCSCAGLRMPTYSSNGEIRRPASAPLVSAQPKNLTDKVKIEKLATEPFKISGMDQNFKIDWPVDRAHLTRGFFKRTFGRPHLGVDLAGPKGTPIYASHDGIVIFAGTGFTGFGKFIIIETKGDWATFYGHLDQIKVKMGQRVARGEILGAMGMTGRASGVHLHFELRHKKKAIDPLPYLNRGVLASNQ